MLTPVQYQLLCRRSQPCWCPHHRHCRVCSQLRAKRLLFSMKAPWALNQGANLQNHHWPPRRPWPWTSRRIAANLSRHYSRSQASILAFFQVSKAIFDTQAFDWINMSSALPFQCENLEKAFVRWKIMVTDVILSTNCRFLLMTGTPVMQQVPCHCSIQPLFVTC